MRRATTGIVKINVLVTHHPAYTSLRPAPAKKEAKLTKEEIIAAIKEMTVIELSEMVKALEEAYQAAAQELKGMSA